MSVQHLPELPVESTKNMLISGLTWQGQRELSVGCLTIQSWQKRTKSCLLASIVFHESPGTTLTFFRVSQVHTKSRPSGRASLHSLWCSRMSMRIHRVIYSLSLNSVESIAFDHPGPSSSYPPFCANIPIICPSRRDSRKNIFTPSWPGHRQVGSGAGNHAPKFATSLHAVQVLTSRVLDLVRDVFRNSPAL